MTLLIAAGDLVSRTLASRVAETLPTLHTLSAATPEEFAQALESRPFEIVVVTAALLQSADKRRRALLAESEVILVTDYPGDSIRLRTDDFVVASRDARELAEELLARVATALYRFNRRVFTETPTPELVRDALAETASFSLQSASEEMQTIDFPGEHRAFDLESFAANYGDSPEIMHEILRIYLDEAPQRLESMRRGLAEKDFVRVAKAAHSLANTSGTLQSERAVRAARRLEGAARLEDREASKAAADELHAVVESMLSDIAEVFEDES